MVQTSNYLRTVNVTASGLPDGATFDAETWDLRWTPTHLQSGKYTVTLTAVDDGDGTGAPATTVTTVPITVRNINRAPVVVPIDNVVIARGATGEFSIASEDAENNARTLVATSEMPGFPLPAFITFTDNGDGTGRFQMAPAAGDRGDHAIKVTITDDGDGNPDEKRATEYVFIVSVESLNEPPLLRHLGDVVAIPGKPMQIPVLVSDLDQDGLSYGVAGLPAGATITPSAVYGVAMITWTPTTADLGSYDATVTVRDSGNGDALRAEQAVAAFRVNVRNANSAPLLVPVGNQSVAEGELLQFQLRGVDTDGDALSYRVIDLPSGATLDGASGVFSWRPALNRAGTYSVSFAATDGDQSSVETIDIAVANTNQLPVFVPVITQLAREGGELRFSVVVADADADPIQLAATAGMPAGAVFVPSRGEFVWTPGYEQAGEHVITLTAADPSGIAVNYDLTILVANVNRAPKLAESNHQFLIGEAGSFTIAATDPDAGTLLKFSALDLPEGASVDRDTGMFRWTPGPGQAGQYIVTLLADDGLAVDRQNIVLRASLELPPPTLRIELTPSFAAVPNQRILVSAIASSFADIASVRLFVEGSEVPLDANGRAFITPTQPGKLNLRAVAVDVDGRVGERSTQLKVRDPADTLAPIVGLAASLGGARLSGPVSLEGGVADANLDVWRLEIARRGVGDWTVLASGESALEGSLHSFDPRTWADGLYALRLVARDIGGRTSTTRADIEIATGTKAGAYQRQDVDLSIDLGGAAFTLTRQYQSLESRTAGAFGWGWGLSGSDIRIETDVPLSGREHLGVFEAVDDGARLWLTLPTGERAGFSFTPRVEMVGTLAFYRPAWTADAAHGWTLDSVDALLQKSGARYFDAVSGLPYNPLAGNYEGFDYSLTAPDGTRYRIDATQGIKQIEQPGGARLFVSDNGITADSGATLQFVRDAAGRITRVVAPDGTSLVYQYDPAGLLSALRNLSTGEGFRYAYDIQGRLTAVVRIGQGGTAIDYGADGQVTERSILADLGGAAAFAGQARSGVAAAGSDDLYTFSVRASEILGTAGGQLILRATTSGGATPVIQGLTPLSVMQSGGTTTALYGISAEGLYRLAVQGEGAYELQLGVAGDLNTDGVVDGLDSAAISAPAAVFDITGDGALDRADRQVLFANYGFVVNAGPRLASTLPTVFTHEDLGVLVDLSQVASDPDGDDVFFRIVDAEHGHAALSADGRYLLYRPDAGYTGPASLQIAADDGFNASPLATLAVTVSDAPLVGIDFVQRRLLGDVGDNFLVVLEGDFADQQDVLLPLDYVSLGLLDPSIASLSAQGLLSLTQEGSTALVAQRGDIVAATLVGAGVPADPAGLITYYFGIDAYPDSVAILPNGGTRQTVVKRGESGSTYVNRAADGTLYFSGNADVADVTADGLITGRSVGETTVTVINRYAEDQMRVVVQPPMSGSGVARVSEKGGIVANAEGVLVAFGAGQLDGDATVTVTSIDEAALSLPTPRAPDGTETFKYLAAFDLDIQGSELNGPVQVAIPVQGDFTPGEKVFFFQKMRLPTGPNGDEADIWAVVDSAIVGSDGLARTASPPFPGLSNRGSVLVARAAQPVGIITIDAGFLMGIAVATSMTLGMAAASGSLVGAAVFGGIAGSIASMAALAFLGQRLEVQLWRQWGANKAGYNLDIDVPPDGAAITITRSLPTPPQDPAELTKPRITLLEAPTISPGNIELRIEADNVVVPGSGFGVERRAHRLPQPGQDPLCRRGRRQPHRGWHEERQVHGQGADGRVPRPGRHRRRAPEPQPDHRRTGLGTLGRHRQGRQQGRLRFRRQVRRGLRHRHHAHRRALRAEAAGASPTRQPTTRPGTLYRPGQRRGDQRALGQDHHDPGRAFDHGHAADQGPVACLHCPQQRRVGDRCLHAGTGRCARRRQGHHHPGWCHGAGPGPVRAIPVRRGCGQGVCHRPAARLEELPPRVRRNRRRRCRTVGASVTWRSMPTASGCS